MIILDLNGSKAKKCYHNFSGQEHLYVVYKRVYRPPPPARLRFQGPPLS